MKAPEYIERRVGEAIECFPEKFSKAEIIVMMEEYAEQRVKACGISPVSDWVDVSERLPEILETVWIANDKGWINLGCRVWCEDSWHWASTNGIIYIEDGKIVSECESDDLDVTKWRAVGSPPCR